MSDYRLYCDVKPLRILWIQSICTVPYAVVGCSILIISSVILLVRVFYMLKAILYFQVFSIMISKLDGSICPSSSIYILEVTRYTQVYVYLNVKLALLLWTIPTSL